MFGLSELRTIVIAIAISSVCGFGGGYYVERQFNKATEVSKLINEQKTTAKSIVTAEKQSQAIATEITKSNTREKQVKRIVDERILATRPVITPLLLQTLEKEKQNDTSMLCPNWTLDVGTVRMLNALRSNNASRSPAGGYGAAQASAVIPGSTTSKER